MNTSKTLLLTIFTIIILLSTFQFVSNLYFTNSPLRLDSPQADYFTLKQRALASPVDYWAELGKDSLITPVIDSSIFKLTLSNFSRGKSFAREVYWSIQALNTGLLEISFPSATKSTISIYLTDGDSFHRMSRIRSDNNQQDLIADDLHNGKWFDLSISNTESASGIKQIQIDRLNGENISISAIKITSQ